MLFKKELCITMSMQAQSQIRDVLRQHSIQYDVETIDRNNSIQPLPSNRGCTLIYRIYVKKKDYEMAQGLIRHISLV